MYKVVVFGITLLLVMEGLVWYVLQMNKADVQPESLTTEVIQEQEVRVAPASVQGNVDATMGEVSSEYPKVTTEIVNGRTERTIHMGVRKWVWEPSTLRAKQGELVRLVIHNADVSHPLVIPELGIEADVPPEGAVVEFEVKKRGSFDFLCGTYCGVGHAEMQGTLIVE